MSMDSEWCSCPCSRLPSQLVHLINRAPLWLAVFVPSTATELPAIVANIAYPTKATDHSRLEVETAQVV